MSNNIDALIRKILPDLERVKSRLDVAAEMDPAQPDLPDILEELSISANPTDTYALPAKVMKRIPDSWLQPRAIVIYEAKNPAQAPVEVLANDFAEKVAPQMRMTVKSPTGVKQPVKVTRLVARKDLLNEHRSGRNVGYTSDILPD